MSAVRFMTLIATSLKLVMGPIASFNAIECQIASRLASNYFSWFVYLDRLLQFESFSSFSSLIRLSAAYVAL